ncbi:hypothetical protein BpHYR1_041876 [Brachionus plicatilis]|uniref:Uncharacterized protein n=1 Tax=Brachionus plicatilis TaxID=10195 RepID=A0A3M7Q9F4_BRAPC|nr:hypothetical protein BpHYR1_041876 [Brachionus plicatilis]
MSVCFYQMMNISTMKQIKELALRYQKKQVIKFIYVQTTHSKKELLQTKIKLTLNMFMSRATKEEKLSTRLFCKCFVSFSIS